MRQFRQRGAVRKKVIEKEIVQLVRTETVLGIARRRTGHEFGRDRRLGDLAQQCADRLRTLRRDFLQRREDHGLRDRGVDLIHAHMVAVVGVPAESNLGKVSRTDHQRPFLVGQVHENLRPLPGLHVLENNVVHRLVMSDVPEMPATGLADVDDTHLDSQRLREGDGSTLRLLGGGEPRHDDGEERRA